MKNLLILFVTLFCIYSCDDLDRIEGMGPIVEEKLEVSDFTGVDLDIPIEVNLEQGEIFEVIAKGHQNIIDRLRTPVRNNKLNIDFEKGNYKDFELELNITMPDLNYIGVDGAGKYTVGTFDIEELRCHIDGAGNLNFNDTLFLEKDLRIDIDGTANTYMQSVDADNIEVHVDGTGNLTLRGVANNLDVNIDGVGDVEAFALESKNVKVTVDGLGKTEVTVTEVLDVDIDGLGNIYYKGQPTIYKEIDGLGSLIDAN